MVYKIVVSHFAYLDTSEAYEWYELQRAGLGDEFLTELELAYKKIANHPEYFGFIDERKILRDYHIRRFPFTVVYRIDTDVVVVISVHHTSKHPSKWYRDIP